MRLRLLVITVIFAGCGAPAEQSGAALPQQQTPATQTALPDQASAPASPQPSAAPAAPAATVDNNSSMLVADAALLPPCSAEREGVLVYVADEKAFKACLQGAWAAIDIQGARGDRGVPGVTGPAGADGAAGAAGAAGADGASNRIKSSIGCNGALQGTAVNFSYSVALMASGDVFVTGSVRGVAFETAQSAFYSALQVGAATAAVFVESDMSGTANAGYWKLELNRTTLVATITYTDADVIGGVQCWTMTPDKCVVNAY